VASERGIYVVKDPERAEVEALDQFGKLAGQRVLEIGAGEGRMTWRYAAGTSSVIGIDIDPERLNEAVRNQPKDLVQKTSFYLAAAEALPFPDASFDTAILAWSL
jgi:ubiquinone/menaquinone biosynthesis C-methylase UbiE